MLSNWNAAQVSGIREETEFFRAIRHHRQDGSFNPCLPTSLLASNQFRSTETPNTLIERMITLKNRREERGDRDDYKYRHK